MSELAISLLTFAVIATASPGGATTLATASGMRFGLTRSLPLVFGIAVGLASLVGIVAGGLGSLVMSWPALQFWLRLFGSAYLLWLAWTIGTAAPGVGCDPGPSVFGARASAATCENGVHESSLRTCASAGRRLALEVFNPGEPLRAPHQQYRE